MKRLKAQKYKCYFT